MISDDKVIIRDTEVRDVEGSMLLMEEAYKATPSEKADRHTDHIIQWVTATCDLKNTCFSRVVESDGEIVGILIGFIDRDHLGNLIAQTLISYTRYRTTELLKQFVEWAKEKDAQSVVLTVIKGRSAYENIVKTLGFEETGKIYTQEI